MSESNFATWDLREIATELIARFPVIKRLYLFGSRAYKTNSLRSDIDLLACTDGEMLNDAEINDWLPVEFPPVDLFWTYDNAVARSAANGSTIVFRNKSPRNYKDLPDQLDAILIWSEQHGFAEDVPFQQKALKNASFAMSIIPGSGRLDSTECINTILKRIEESGVHTFFAGSTIQEITRSIIQIVDIGMQKPNSFASRANSFSFDTLKLRNEYDFQNYIHALLRPVFRDIEPEPVTVIIDGNKKKADFSLNRNQIIIEAKWIDTTTKKDEVLKTLEGLKDFYSENPQVKSLLFLILYKKSVALNSVLLTERFAREFSDPPVFIRFIQNTYE